MDSLDKLLAQLKSEYEPGKTAPQQPQSDVIPPSKTESIIDNILAEVKADVEGQAVAKNLSIPAKYEPVKPTLQQLPPDVLPSFITTEPKSQSVIDNILAEVKADVEEQAAAEELRKQEQLKQERLRQEKIKAKQLEVLKKQAKEWLEKLDPFSSEGLWFERFAEGYPSKLEAAIEYLQDNQ